MSGTLLRFLLRRHRFALVACWIVPVLIAIAVGLVYPTYASEREALSRMLRVFGRVFGSEALDLLSPLGFLSLPFQHPLTLLMLAMSAAVVPLALPAGDRGRGSLDLLLATRLSRRQLARTALGAILLAGLAFGWAPYFGVAIAASLSGYANEIPFGTCVLVAVNAGALVVALGSVALVCSATADDGGSATTRFVGFVVVTLALDIVARIWKAGKWLQYANLLGYYRPPEVLARQASPWASIGILLAFAAVAYAAAEILMDRRRRA